MRAKQTLGSDLRSSPSSNVRSVSSATTRASAPFGAAAHADFLSGAFPTALARSQVNAPQEPDAVRFDKSAAWDHGHRRNSR